MTTLTVDYLKFEGDKAFRVHVRLRLQKFAPTDKTTYPGSGNKDKDPWFRRLGDSRKTLVKFWSDKSGKVVELRDDWHHSGTTDPLPERWTGFTVFDYREESASPIIMEELPVPDTVIDIAETTKKNVDHWLRSGTTWTRYHVTSRKGLFEPTMSPDGPDPRYLEDNRVTTVRHPDVSTKTIMDDWREPRETTKSLIQS